MKTVSDWVAILKAIAEILKAISWPIVVGVIAWHFRKEVARLIGRVSKFKAFGTEMEAITEEEFRLNLENAKAATRPEAIEQVKTLLVQAHGKATATASVKFDLVESLNLLMELATTEPRAAIIRSWKLLAKAVLRTAKVSGENTEPNSEEISTALNQLESSVELPEGLVRSIRNLQQIAKIVQSQVAYVPSPNEAAEFVLYSAAARTDLGEKVG